MKTTKQLLVFSLSLFSLLITNKVNAQKDKEFRNIKVRDIFARGHLYFYALEGNKKSGTAYVQARDKSNYTNIAMQIRSQYRGQIRNAIRIGAEGNTTVQQNLTIAQALDIKGNTFMKNGLYFSAQEGFGQSGTAFLEAKDNSGNSSIGLQLRAQNNGVSIDAFKINPDGNIGIGIVDPQAKLDVLGNVKISGNTTLTNDANLEVSGDLTISGSTNLTEEVNLEKGIKVKGNISSLGALDIQNEINFSNVLNSQQVLVNKGVDFRLSNIESSHFSVKNAFGSDALYVKTDGKVGFGAINPNNITEQVHVAGRIKATGFIADASSFPDYVFAKDYKLMPLKEVKNYTDENHHLPGMPSEKEVVNNGLNVKKVVTISVEKIEELYLHTINQEEKIKQQEDRLKMMQKVIFQLQEKLQQLEEKVNQN
ncbi:hypothetical protein [Tenacibaculum jejuense]|uniref:Peptidase S74 domain-containing protein n=1 Tax=Tenacibaculum jejuense TaxID=584609 RepID=A0A238U646_9FLAO|nr:hypothetical protein [Tenacibaculum jejuense]SNR13830.1 Protein of unknown function precursor [Tenacibaculum jejuense]